MCSILLNGTWWFVLFITLFCSSRTTALMKTQPYRQLWRCLWLKTDCSYQFSRQRFTEWLFMQPTNTTWSRRIRIFRHSLLNAKDVFFSLGGGARSISIHFATLQKTGAGQRKRRRFRLTWWFETTSSWIRSETWVAPRPKPSTASVHRAPSFGSPIAWRATSIEKVSSLWV